MAEYSPDPAEFAHRVTAIRDHLETASFHLGEAANLSQHGIIWDGIETTDLAEFCQNITDSMKALKKEASFK